MDDQQVTDLISRALAAVKSAKTPPALQEVAFTSALGLLIGSPAQLPHAGNIGAEGKRRITRPTPTGKPDQPCSTRLRWAWG